MELTALFFPGQGSQYVGMGYKLAEREPSFRPILNETLDRARAVLGIDIADVIEKGPIEQLTETRITQPALFAVSAAYWRLGVETGRLSREVAALAGHSLGEYGALLVAGAFDFETGLKIVAARGRAMQAAAEKRPGGMGAIVGLPAKLISELCQAWSTDKAPVQIAGFNSPIQTVISGAPASVDAVLGEAKAKGAKLVTPLNVGGAFHSVLMRPAAEEFRKSLEIVEWRPLASPVIMNVDAAICSPAEGKRDILIDKLVRQLTEPVHWAQTIERTKAMGIQSYVEVGPGKVLTGFQKASGLMGQSVSSDESWGLPS